MMRRLLLVAALRTTAQGTAATCDVYVVGLDLT